MTTAPVPEAIGQELDVPETSYLHPSFKSAVVMPSPGATISGLIRRSRVLPWLKDAISLMSRVVAPTPITFLQFAGDDVNFILPPLPEAMK